MDHFGFLDLLDRDADKIFFDVRPGREDGMFIADESQQYVRVARHAYQKMLEIEGSMSAPDWARLAASDRRAMETFQANIAQKEAAARESYVAVVFSALAVEALINRVGITNTSAKFFEKYLDKLDVVAKWVVVPVVANLPIKVDRAGQAFEQLTKLVRDRNKLVHSKARRLTSLAEIVEFVQKYRPSDEAANAIGTLDAMSAELGSPLGDLLR